jgi:hypothetical protein
MALTDLSRVTAALERLLAQNITTRLEPGLVVTATAAPPSALGEGSVSNVISVYLHHVAENPQLRNLPPQGGSGRAPVRHTPLALTLYYVVTAHHLSGSSDPGADTLTQQKLLGYALKTLHDHPVLSDATAFPGRAPILEEVGLAGGDNRFEIAMRPVPVEEALAFWANDDDHTPRLAAYVEVRVVMLEPEPAERVVRRVLSVGTHVVTGGAPRLERSYSVVSFALPRGVFGASTVQRSYTSPAAASLFDGAAPPSDAPYAENHRFTLEGTNLHGAERALVLRGGGRTVRIDLDAPPASRHPATQAWELRASSTQVHGAAHRQVWDDASQGLVSLLPGLFRAHVVLTQTSKSGRAVRAASNETLLALAPQIARIAPGAHPGEWRITLVGEYLARPVPSPGGDVPADLALEIGVGGEALVDVRRTHAGPPPSPLPPGTYDREPGVVVVRPDPSGAIRELAPDHPVPVTLVVNGAEAPPAWIEASS